MKCDSRASLLARTFASPCPGCEPKVKVTTKPIIIAIVVTKNPKDDNVLIIVVFIVMIRNQVLEQQAFKK
jgi:hypothetical protein